MTENKPPWSGATRAPSKNTQVVHSFAGSRTPTAEKIITVYCLHVLVLLVHQIQNLFQWPILHPVHVLVMSLCIRAEIMDAKPPTQLNWAEFHALHIVRSFHRNDCNSWHWIMWLKTSCPGQQRREVYQGHHLKRKSCTLLRWFTHSSWKQRPLISPTIYMYLYSFVNKCTVHT